MEGWKEGTIKSVASIGSGRDYKHLKEGNVPVFGTGGYMTSVNDFLYEGETVCIGRKGTIDTPQYHSGKIWTVDTLFYTHSFENITPKLLYYIFQSINWKKYNEATGVPSLSKKTIEQINIRFPESEIEQYKIINILDTIDQNIAQTQKLIAKYKNIKQGLMHDLLTYGIDENGVIRKPETHTFVEKGGIVVPEEWEVVDLIDICQENGLVRGPFGGALKKEMFVEKGIKVYEQKNAIYRNTNLGDYFIDQKKYMELKRFEVVENDFIVSCSGTIGKIFCIPKNFPKGIINQALLKISINQNKMLIGFFYKYFEWDNFQTTIIDNSQGGAMKNLIGMEKFKTTKISKPKILEQKK